MIEKRRIGWRVVAALTTLAGSVIACIDGPLLPDVGPQTQPFCAQEDSDPGVDVSFERDIVGAIFDPDQFACFDCHREDADTPLGFEVGGFDLATYDALRQGGVVSGATVVIPGRPCDSVLFQKVTAAPPYGARMPLDGPPFLDSAAQLAIHDWIAEGALDN